MSLGLAEYYRGFRAEGNGRIRSVIDVLFFLLSVLAVHVVKVFPLP